MQSCGLMHISSLHTIHMLYVILFSSHCISLYYSLSKLTQLEILYIEDNLLNTEPDVVSSLTSLKQLYMSSCGISCLPERFVCHMFITTSQYPYCLPLNISHTTRSIQKNIQGAEGSYNLCTHPEFSVMYNEMVKVQCKEPPPPLT